MSEQVAVEKTTVPQNSSIQPTSNLDLLITTGMDRGASIEQMQQLFELKRTWEADEARKAYTVAVAAFKADPPKIIKDKVNKQYGSMYSSIEGMVNSVVPALSRHGLSHRWGIRQTENGITVTCVLTHILGHSENVSLFGPPDTSGSKNTLQQIKSTLTYLKGATLEAITGLASETFNQSDDGNGASIKYITSDQESTLKTLIAQTGAEKKKFCAYMGVEKLKDIQESHYNNAVKALQKKNKKNDPGE